MGGMLDLLHRGLRGYDPRTLLTVKATSRKAVQLAAFLPEATRQRIQRRKKDRMVLTEGPDGSLTVKASEPNLRDITWDEWSGANVRLMAAILADGSLRREDRLEFYLAYTARIYDLAGKFEWSSVMEFDTMYREHQAQQGFPWGTPSTHLETHVLVPKRQVGQQYQGVKKDHRAINNDSGPRFTGRRVEDCRIFLSKRILPIRGGCKYRHPEPRDQSKN